MNHLIDEFAKIEGIGKTDANHLVLVGINSIDELKETDANFIYLKLIELKNRKKISYVNSELAISKWIAAAKLDNHLYSMAKKRHQQLLDRTFKSEENKLKTEYSKEFNKILPFDAFKTFFGKDNDLRKCIYCNITEFDISKLIENKQINTSRIVTRGKTLEIDRTSNPKGRYEIGNIGLCCYWCNNAKTDEFSDNEFIGIGEAMEKIWVSRLKTINQ